MYINMWYTWHTMCNDLIILSTTIIFNTKNNLERLIYPFKITWNLSTFLQLLNNLDEKVQSWTELFVSYDLGLGIWKKQRKSSTFVIQRSKLLSSQRRNREAKTQASTVPQKIPSLPNPNPFSNSLPFRGKSIP